MSLVAAWRETSDKGRHDAVERKLAELAAEGGPAAVEQAILGLTDVAGMFIELYADSAGTSLGSVLQDAAALTGADSSVRLGRLGRGGRKPGWPMSTMLSNWGLRWRF